MDLNDAPTLELSRSRFLRNLAAVHEKIAPSSLLIAMKDDAYGHGIEWTMDAALAAPGEPVAVYGGYDVPTSLRIRAAGPDVSVFAWATSTRDEVEQALSAGVELGVGTTRYLDSVIEVASELGVSARVHLKADTGLHRNGVRPEEWQAFVDRAIAAERAGHVQIVGVWSHLAEASDAEDDDAAAEFSRAVEVVRAAGGTPKALHLTASAASWWRPELRGTVSRIGAFCYGIRSADGPDVPGVTPVAALRATVRAVHDDTVEVGIGFLHGLPSTLDGAQIGTPGGARNLRSVGAVTSLVEAWPDAAAGDTVRVFGPGAHGESDATALAERIGTVGEEILTRLTDQVRRVSVD